jgi:hypothetical protein
VSRALLLTTPLPSALVADAETLLPLLRSDAPASERSARALHWILAVVEESLRYHFREPIAAFQVGALTRAGLNMALDLAVRGIRGPARAVISGLNDAQLRRVADEIEQRLYPDPHT